jgi:hypothetical protein
LAQRAPVLQKCGLGTSGTERLIYTANNLKTESPKTRIYKQTKEIKQAL